MGDWPTDFMPNLPCVTPFSSESLGPGTRVTGSAAVGSATLGNQVARFFPWVIETPIVIVKGFTMNGTTANGTIDVGVYDHEFNLIVAAGATTQSGTSAIQEYDITDTTLMPGRYWMACVCNGTGTVFGRAINDEIELATMPLLVQGSQTSLPSTATAAKDTGSAPVIPVFGFSTSTVI